MSWSEFFTHKIHKVLDENAFEYKDFSVSYKTNAFPFLETNNVTRNKVTPVDIIKLNVLIKDLGVNGDFSELNLYDIDVMKLPIQTDNGFVIRGSRYFYLQEVKPSDGWYLLNKPTKAKKNNKSEVEEEEIEDLIKEEITEQLDYDSEEIDEDSYSDEIPKGIDSELKELSKLNSQNESEEDIDSWSDLYDDFEYEDLERYDLLKDSLNYMLLYRAPFGRSIKFYSEVGSDGIRKFYVSMVVKNQNRKVSWFVFLRAIYPTLSAEEVYSKFKDFDIIKDAFAYELSKTKDAVEKDNGSPNIYGSSEDCARYVLSKFYGYNTRRGNTLQGVDNPIEELHFRLKALKCDTKVRNENIFSFTRLEGLELISDIEADLDSVDLDYLRDKLGKVEVGCKLTKLQLVVLDKCKSLKSVKVKNNGKEYLIYKPDSDINFIEETEHQFYNYLLMTEGIGQIDELDSFKNKVIEPVDSKIENTLRNILNTFKERFITKCDEKFGSANIARLSSTEGSAKSIVTGRNLSEFIDCFKIDINVGYKRFLEKLQSDSASQQRDDTNSIGEFGQTKKVKYSLSKNVPASLREVQEDQYGYLCPYSTSEGGNIGLNLTLTSEVIVKDCIPLKPVFVLKDGRRIRDTSGLYKYKVEYLNPGQAFRSVICSARHQLGEKEDSNELCPDAYIGSEKVMVKWNQVEYSEIHEGQNISAQLGMVPSNNRDGGKRGPMSVSTLQSIYPLLWGQRNYTDTGIAQYNDVGVVRGLRFLESAAVSKGLNLMDCDINEYTYIRLGETIQYAHHTVLKYEVVNSEKLEGTDYTYDIPTLTPTVKKSLRHGKINIKPDNRYTKDDIIVYMNDTSLEEREVKGDANLVDAKKVSEYGMALGRRIKVAFLVDEGYNYEDAMVFDEEVVASGIFSILRIFNITDDIEKKPTGIKKKLTNESEREEYFRFGSSHTETYINANGLPSVGDLLKVGDTVIAKEKIIIEGSNPPIRSDCSIRLKEGKKDKGYVVNTTIEDYTKEDGSEWTRATVTLAYVSNIQEGDKFTGGHGNKGVMAREMPHHKMHYLQSTGEVIDILLNPTGVLPRNNIGSLLEPIQSEIGRLTNSVTLMEPFADLDIVDILNQAELLGIKEEVVINGLTNKPFDRKILVAEIYLYRSEHDVKGKYNAEGGTGKINEMTLAANRGPGGGQRIGEQSYWSLAAGNCFEVLNSAFTIQSSDLVALKTFVDSCGTVEPQELENNLISLMKVYYRLMGIEFEDFNKGMFKVITDEMVEEQGSRFIPTNSYDIEDSSLYGSTIRTSDVNLLKSRSFLNARSINLHYKFIFPEILGSKFITWNMWYIPSDIGNNGILNKISKELLNTNSDRVYSGMVDIKTIKPCSKKTLDDIISGKKAVVYIDGLILPIVVNNSKFEAEVNKGLFPSKIFRSITGYKAVPCLLLGEKYLYNHSDTLSTRNISSNILLALNYGVRENKLNNISVGVSSYSVSDYLKDLLSMCRNFENEGKSYTIEPVELAEFTSKAIDYYRNLEREFIDMNYLVYEDSNLNLYLNGFMENCDAKDLNEFNIGTTMNLNHLFKRISCSWLWIPPRAFRKDSPDGKLRDELNSRLTTIAKQAAKFEKSSENKTIEDITSNDINLMYKLLDGLRDFCISKMKDHKSRNANLRDQVLSTRIHGCGRGYIAVDPTLGIDEVGVPMAQATEIFSIFLADSNTYSETSTLYKIITKRLVEIDISDSDKINDKVIKDILSYLSAKNREAFRRSLKKLYSQKGVHEIIEMLGKSLDELGCTESSREYEIFDAIFFICRNELKEALNNLMKKYPISLERAPSLWLYSNNAFYGRVVEGYVIKLNALMCRAFNADFDGDQMAMFIFWLQNAIDEMKAKMLPSKRIINIKDGKPVPDINQDMALGIYWATCERENKIPLLTRSQYPRYRNSVESEINSLVSKGYSNAKSLMKIYEEDELLYVDEQKSYGTFTDATELAEYVRMSLLNVHDYIVFQVDDRRYFDTVGRILLNSLLPKHDGFTNYKSFIVGSSILMLREYSKLNEIEADIRTQILNNSDTIVIFREGKYYTVKVSTIRTDVTKESDLESIAMEEVKPFWSYYYIGTKSLGFTAVRQSNIEELMKIVQEESEEELVRFLNNIKDFGFEMATLSGITLSLFDFRWLNDNKLIKDKVDNLRNSLDEAKLMVTRGFKTDEEYKRMIKELVPREKTEIANYFETSMDRYSNIFMIIDSGARGSFSQLVDLSVMIGLPMDSNSNVILRPALHGYSQGLTAREYHDTAYASRHALIISAITTGKIGEVSRELVNTIEHDKIDINICDVDSQRLELKYDVILPSSFNVKNILVAFENPSEDEMRWNNLIEVWERFLDSKDSKDTATITTMKVLCQKFSILKMKFKSGSEIRIEPVRYKMTGDSKMKIINRTIDLNTTENFAKHIGNPGITLGVNDLGRYSTMTYRTIKDLESQAVNNVFMYTAMSCGSQHGICCRCYGSKVDNTMPHKNEMVGIQSAQILGQIATQTAQNTHKQGIGKSVSGFSVISNIFAQHNIGDFVLVATQEGVVRFRNNNNKTIVEIIGEQSVENIGILDKNSQKLVSNGDYVKQGDLIAFTSILNYSLMSRILSRCMEHPSERLFKSRINMIDRLSEAYGAKDLHIRHLDILMRELLGFGCANESYVSKNKIISQGAIYPIRDLEQFNLDYTPIMVSTTKSMHLNNKSVAAQAKSHLKMKAGDAAVMQETSSIESPLDSALRGLDLGSLYSENPTLNEKNIFEKYQNRAYGESIYKEPHLIVQKASRLSRNLIKSSMTVPKKDSLNIFKRDNKKVDISSSTIEDLFNDSDYLFEDNVSTMNSTEEFVNKETVSKGNETYHFNNESNSDTKRDSENELEKISENRENSGNESVNSTDNEDIPNSGMNLGTETNLF